MTFCVSENRRAALSFSETLQAFGVLEFSKQTKLIKKGYYRRVRHDNGNYITSHVLLRIRTTATSHDAEPPSPQVLFALSPQVESCMKPNGKTALVAPFEPACQCFLQLEIKAGKVQA